mgnify:CR=1 FL=1
MVNQPLPGSLLAERFLLESQIGAGGMGTVLRARDAQSGKWVAVKLLQPQVDPQETARFEREAVLLAELQHPHIVSYVAHGISEGGQPYLAMEWLEGEDLEQFLRRGLPSVAQCVDLLTGVSAALAEAHKRGIVHRDLKPSNLFLRGGDPRKVVVLDFGLARRALRSGGLTRTGVIVGTPEYMAPEQARGEQDVGLPADIFSLGCLMFECLSGDPPFVGEHLTAVLVKVLLEEPPLLHTLRPEVPLKLSELIARMLNKEPQQRFASGLELNEAVRRLDLAATTTELIAPGPTRLTPHEQQFFGVAVALHPSLDLGLGGDPFGTLRDALAEMGIGVERLADGSLVATALPSASAADQALLAARCGLLMKQHLPAAEVAVATGRGRLRGQMPIGEAIDRALLLLDTGTPGTRRPSAGVWLDPRTGELLSGRLDIAMHEGRIQLARDQQLNPREDERQLLGQPAPFVGREQELGTLESVLAVCVGDSVARAVGVIAPPGLGKSRLRHEFLRGALQRHPSLQILLGRGDMMQAGAPYAILCEALRSLCGLVGGEPLAVQQQRLRERLGQNLTGDPETAARIIDFLGELCGVHFPAEGHRTLQIARTSPKVMHEQLTHAFLAWLRSECLAAPVLLVLEDLHWGDALTVQLIAQALHELSELPLLVLALARPEVQTLFPSFWNASVLQEMPLRTLSRRAAERLSHEVLRRALGGAVDPATVARIVEQGAGHPLLLEELLRSVAEGRGDALPETVLAMLLARLSQLDPGARQALRAASVYGESFSRAGVAALAAGEAAADLDLSLLALVRAECIEQQRELGPQETERYKFRHALVRDAAYSLLTDDNRVVAHRLAGAYLEQRGHAEAAVLAEHAERGLEGERAAHFFLEAARQALGRYDPEQAQRHATRALACPTTDEQLGILRAIQAWICLVRMDLPMGYEHALAAVDVLRPGSYWWAKAIGICFYSFFMVGRFEHIERLIRSFMGPRPEADAGIAFLEAGNALCIFLTNVGQRHAAAATIARMTEVAGNVDLQDHGALLMADSYRLLKLEPDLQAAIHRAQQGLALVINNGESLIQVQAIFYLGVARLAAGEVAEGERILREGLAFAMRIREDFGTVVTHLHLALSLAADPDPDKQAEARQISAAYREQSQLGPAMLGLCHHIDGQTLLMAGDLEGAEAALRTATAMFTPLLPSRLLVTPLLVEVLLRQGRVAEARALADEGLARIAEQGGLGQCELPVRLAVILTRLATGDEPAAHDEITTATAQIHRRAALLADHDLQRTYLGTPDNRRILAFAGLEGPRIAAQQR